MTSADIPSALPVVVVGAGPVGITLATALSRRGVPVVLAEAEATAKTDWRASTFHAPTLELLSELDVVQQMHDEGLVVPRYQFRDRQRGMIAQFDFTLLAGETCYPYRLQLNQQHLVRMLVDRCAGHEGVTLRFGCRVVGLAQDADGVTVELQTGNGTERVRGSYVVGADGAASAVRTLLGIPFDGFTYPARFLIVSTSADMRQLLPGIADVNYIADPQEWLFVLRTPESWRVIYPLPEGQSREEATEPGELQRHLQAVAPYAPGYPVVDCQVYNVHQRVADTFRAGRALLIGDAAHINSPLGGVGLNSGIHDAMDLGRRLVRILMDGADADLELDTFAALRHRVAVDYVKADTMRNTERLSERDESKRQAHYAELQEIAADPDRARDWCRRASLLESVQRFGIGLPPREVARREGWPVSQRPESDLVTSEEHS